MKRYFDLALELFKNGKSDIKGITIEEKRGLNGVKRTDIEIKTQSAEKKSGKPRGNYITVERKIKDRSVKNREYLIKVLAAAIRELIDKNIKKDSYSVLVVGLGNRGMTADSLGNETIKNILVTRKIEGLNGKLNSVSTLSAGVGGVTGIDSEEMLSCVTEKIKPDLIICVDALSASAPERIASVFQITDTGIVPGSGSGREKTQRIDKSSSGVPVIAIGAPTVVAGDVIAEDCVNELIDRKILKLGNDTEEEVSRLVKRYSCDIVVTPREVDKIIEDCALIISSAINLAVHKYLGYKDILNAI